jgi:hypothetical protein
MGRGEVRKLDRRVITSAFPRTHCWAEWISRCTSERAHFQQFPADGRGGGDSLVPRGDFFIDQLLELLSMAREIRRIVVATRVPSYDRNAPVQKALRERRKYSEVYHSKSDA